MLMKIWGWYSHCLSSHPLKTQIISSGVLWGLGDIGAQYVTHSTAIKKHIQSTRYENLDKLITMRLKLAPKSARFVAAKVAADGIIFGPLDLLVFFSYMGFSTGKSAAQVKEDVKRDFLPSLILEGGIWPIVQVANFRYVPVQYQLLYVNLFCLIDSAFLSWVDQQKDAPWKQWFKSIELLKGRGGHGGL
ncbi:Protein SYM1 [Linum perenne]